MFFLGFGQNNQKHRKTQNKSLQLQFFHFFVFWVVKICSVVSLFCKRHAWEISKKTCCRLYPIASMGMVYLLHKNHKNQPNVGKYTSPMDGMGMNSIGNRGSHNRVQDACATASAATTAAKSVAAAVAEKRSNSSATYLILVRGKSSLNQRSWPEITLFEKEEK